MRFQSNAAFSKLAPQLVADAYGPFSNVAVVGPNAVETTMLGTPAAGTGWRIRAISIFAGTTTLGLTNDLRAICNQSTICGSWAQATGIWVNWTGDILVTSAVTLHNFCGIQAQGSVYYRSEPLPA